MAAQLAIEHGPDAPLFSLVVPGVPVPWQRTGWGKHGGAYTKSETRRWSQVIQRYAMIELGPRRIDFPIGIEIVFCLPKPKRPKWHLPATKPDIDNLAKTVCDALEQANVITNDSRIVTAILRKRYVNDEEPGVHLRAWRET